MRLKIKVKIFENMVLREIFGPKRDDVTGNEEVYIRRNFMICIPNKILFE